MEGQALLKKGGLTWAVRYASYSPIKGLGFNKIMHNAILNYSHNITYYTNSRKLCFRDGLKVKNKIWLRFIPANIYKLRVQTEAISVCLKTDYNFTNLLVIDLLLSLTTII
jgi:hypothetical protein